MTANFVFNLVHNILTYSHVPFNFLFAMGKTLNLLTLHAYSYLYLKILCNYITESVLSVSTGIVQIKNAFIFQSHMSE